MKHSKRSLTVFFSLIVLGLLFIGLISHGFAAGGYKLLQWTSRNQYTVLSKLLLAVGTPPSPYKEIYDWDYHFEITDTPLHWAAKFGDVKLATSLRRHGAIIDWCCCSCVTPLHHAILNKQPKIVDLLLKSGANANIPYDLSASVMELAEKNGTEEIVELIVSHNKKRDADNKRMRTTRDNGK